MINSFHHFLGIDTDFPFFCLFVGYYMYIETSSPRRIGDQAGLDSPKLVFKGTMCLQFYYHMYGKTIASLQVVINNKIVFNELGEKGNKWLKAAVDVNLSGMYEVIKQNLSVFRL